MVKHVVTKLVLSLSALSHTSIFMFKCLEVDYQTYVSRESDSDSDSKLLRNTLEGRQTFQTCNENQLQFPITTTYSQSTLKYTNTVACAMYNFF